MRKNNKGYVLTWDAMIALVLVTAAVASAMALGFFRNPEDNTFERLNSIAGDALDVMDKNGELDAVVSYYNSGDRESAAEKASTELAKLLSGRKVGYRFMVGGDVLAENIILENDSEASHVTQSTRYLSGAGGDAFMARASLLYNDPVEGITFTINGTSYGNPFPNYEGANWTFDHLGGSYKICVPEDCSGDNTYTYDGSDISTNDAADDAMLRLLKKLDTNSNGILDIDFDGTKMLFRVYSTESSIHSAGDFSEAKLVVWV